MTSTIKAEYRVRCIPEEAGAIAREIALEQTVEVPEALVTDPRIRDEVVGRVVSCRPDDDVPEAQRIVIEYNAALANGQLPQLLNLLYGNISIKPNIALIGVHLPESLLGRFTGPNYGIEGVRALLGVYGRPLLATALKPRGSSPDELAAIAAAFARGGGDIVKDDHNLADDSYEAFRDRVSAIHSAVVGANGATGRNAQYFPNVIARSDDLDRYCEYLVRAGVRGVLVSPLAIGLDNVRRLAETYPLIFMAHPSLTGSYYTDPCQGIAPGVLLGAVFRLMGCDISVFPNYGGRFGLTRDECVSIQDALAAPLGDIAPAMPAPAGGMTFDRIPSMAETYGPESVFLIGGALLSHSGDLCESTRVYLDAINEHFNENLRDPKPEWQSACEIPAQSSGLSLLNHLRFREDFSWEGRPPVNYKSDAALPFEGVDRVELIGRAGEKAAFDLRYFEVAPGGYTSHEKHVHTHVIIGVRGAGMLLRNGDAIEVKPHDVAYVAPMEPHQLRNEGEDPFGFFCIVDHERDRPMEP